MNISHKSTKTLIKAGNAIQKQPLEVFCKNGVLRKAWNFITKETLAQVFSCEFCEISKNTFLTEYLWTTASGYPSVKNTNQKFNISI